MEQHFLNVARHNAFLHGIDMSMDDVRALCLDENGRNRSLSDLSFAWAAWLMLREEMTGVDAKNAEKAWRHAFFFEDMGNFRRDFPPELPFWDGNPGTAIAMAGATLDALLRSERKKTPAFLTMLYVFPNMILLSVPYEPFFPSREAWAAFIAGKVSANDMVTGCSGF